MLTIDEKKKMKLRFGYSTKPYEGFPAGHPVIAYHTAEGVFLFQVYLDNTEIERVKEYGAELGG